MIKTYIYPTYTPSRDKSGNLYIKYFHDAFSYNDDFKVVNRFWQIGIASLFFNLDARLFIIQWVDLIPGKRFGRIQFLIYLVLVFIVRLFGKKIIWVLHNKHAHKGKSKLVDFGMKFMAQKASVVITHSREGCMFFDSMYPNYAGKCRYIPHPVYSQNVMPSKKCEFDYIIWGGIDKRKNIIEFLEFTKSEPFFDQKKILICGCCRDSEYGKKIQRVAAEKKNIVFLNKFFSDEELADLISKSHVILFTYNPESMLSSGALIYSLNFCKPIIGPRVGNFADLEGSVQCYNSFSDISQIKLWNNREKNLEYISENTWDTFPQKVVKLV